MEKNVRPPFFNSDFKFPAQHLLQQKIRQAQAQLAAESTMIVTHARAFYLGVVTVV